MKLQYYDLEFLKLLLRSKDVSDGWRNVSEMCKPIVLKFSKTRPELVEVRNHPVDGNFQVRLTDRGEILCDYI